MLQELCFKVSYYCLKMSETQYTYLKDEGESAFEGCFMLWGRRRSCVCQGTVRSRSGYGHLSVRTGTRAPSCRTVRMWKGLLFKQLVQKLRAREIRKIRECDRMKYSYQGVIGANSTCCFKDYAKQRFSRAGPWLEGCSGVVAQKIIGFGLGSNDSNHNKHGALFCQFFSQRKSESLQYIQTKALNVFIPFCQIIRSKIDIHTLRETCINDSIKARQAIYNNEDCILFSDFSQHF